MAAEVSSLFQFLSDQNQQHISMAGESSGDNKSTALITRDLLGIGSSYSSSYNNLSNESQELDLDSHVPNGYEKRLDLKSGKVYLERSGAVSMSHNHQSQSNSTSPMVQDFNLNFSPSPYTKAPLSLFDDTSASLELKLVTSSSSSPPQPSSNFHSLCTLDKVKSALERVEREPIKKRATSLWKSGLSSSPDHSSSSSSIKETTQEEESEFSSPYAAGCPGCLSYVLIMRNNPKCPRCSSVIPLPMAKKSRIDLNRTN